MNAQALGIGPPKVGLRDRNSPMCALSQHGYGACLLKPKFCIDMNDKPHDWRWTCLRARTMNMNFEVVQHVCYDTGDAVLEYGHTPRPQILHVVKSRAAIPETCASERKLCSRCVLALASMAQNSRIQNLPGGHTCP